MPARRARSIDQTRRQFLSTALAGPLLAQDRRGDAPAAPKPNIVLILADDLPSWVLGCYGNTEIRTPNIDKLAQSGTRFTNSFCNTPICSASRATLFTGRMPRQHGIHDFLTETPVENPPQGQKEPPPSFADETMLFDALAAAGYRNGYTGKWHMGSDERPRKSIEYSYTMRGGSRSYRDPQMFLNGEPVEEKGYLADHITARGIEFIDKSPKDKPFFLTVSHLNPHTPYDGHPEKYYEMYKSVSFDKAGWEPIARNALRERMMLTDIVGNLRRAAASITALDDQVGTLMTHLDRSKLRDNTLVVLTGDNGYLYGRHGLWSKGLASDPINMYEESVQVPMIWNWLGKVPVQGVRPELVSFVDFVPTICDVAGAAVPDRALSGESYWPIAQGKLFGRKEKPWKTAVFGHFRNTEMARDTRYKLVLRSEGAGPNELYDLRADPREKVNLYENPAFLTVRDRLSGELNAWRSKTSRT